MLKVATIGRPVGLRGMLRLRDESDFPAQFVRGARFFLSDGREVEISHFDAARGCVKFAGFDDVDTARTLTGQALFRTIEQTRELCPLGEGDFYYFDIIGLSVSQNGALLGVVSDIIETGGGHLFCIATDGALVERGLAKEFFIPYNDHFVVEISLSAREIRVQNSLEILENS